MRNRYPDHQAEIPISLRVLQQLQGASCSTGYEKEDWEIATEAIDEWLRRHDPNSLSTLNTKGYQWKRLFLPDGTVLRTVFGGRNHHCLVEGDGIIYDGETMSPSGFVNAVGGIRRNAWKCTWILFPASQEWKLADTLRTRVPRPRAPRQASAVRHEAAPQPAFAHAPVTATPVTATPAPVAPITLPHPAREGRIPATASAPHHAPRAVHEQEHKTHTNTEGCSRPPGVSAAPTRSGFRCEAERGTDRRINNDEDRTAALLRHELLPLLYRICGLDRANTDARISLTG